jgi:hypothetical protein
VLQSGRSDQFTGTRGTAYTSSPTAPNEACQISPNLCEASNPQLAIAGNRPIYPFDTIRPGKIGIDAAAGPAN